MDAAALKVGDAIPELTINRVSRQTLALYAGASGDHNPIHIDTDFTRAAGVGDVFAHGMLVMAWLGRALTGFAPQSALRSWGVRFASITQVGARIRCTGTVTERFEQDGERRLRLDIAATDEHGDVKLKGEAVVAVG
ncbi:MAG: MaoC family dehydratase [Rhodospirillaceae bacterium]|nr:MaoC family dehydratase [Rhodospirillaceae bacterium]MYB12960.1 MaoC family dehydratase [Rhodospirillaceae bacterium]MYI49440.1 MaoC family dehydratase [Rhodospirillaceae bacterium]